MVTAPTESEGKPYALSPNGSKGLQMEDIDCDGQVKQGVGHMRD